jgi:hypothetical protein
MRTNRLLPSVRLNGAPSNAWISSAAAATALALAILPALVSVCDTACAVEFVQAVEAPTECAAHEGGDTVEPCSHQLQAGLASDRTSVSGAGDTLPLPAPLRVPVFRVIQPDGFPFQITGVTTTRPLPSRSALSAPLLI